MTAGVIGIAVALPFTVDAAGLPATLPWVADILAVAAGLTRVMAPPRVNASLLLALWQAIR